MFLDSLSSIFKNQSSMESDMIRTPLVSPRGVVDEAQQTHRKMTFDMTSIIKCGDGQEGRIIELMFNQIPDF